MAELPKSFIEDTPGANIKLPSSFIPDTIQKIEGEPSISTQDVSQISSGIRKRGKTGIIGFGVGLTKQITETLGRSVFGVRPGITRLTPPIVEEEVFEAKTPTERAGKIVVTGAEFLLGGGFARGAIKAITRKTPAQLKEITQNLVSRIVQGKPKDIPAASRALADIETQGVKTFKELRNVVSEKTSILSKTLDKMLLAQKGRFKPKDLIITTQVGKTTVKQNFVDDAIEQLDELYRKIKDAPAQARIINLKNKLNTQGLDAKELNDLAKEYGSEFSKRAFSKVTGEPLTSVNAQAFENTRKGIKETVRGKLEGDAAKALDLRQSDLIRVNTLIEKQAVASNKVFQKAEKIGLFKSGAKKLGGVVDIATLGTLSGFISRFVPTSVGIKTLNALDLEKELSKSLKELRKLSGIKNESVFTKTLREMLRGRD